MRADLTKSSVESLEIVHAVGRWHEVWYAKVTVRSSIILGSIEPVHWTTFPHAWLVATQIEFVNLSVHNAFHLLR